VLDVSASGCYLVADVLAVALGAPEVVAIKVAGIKASARGRERLAQRCSAAREDRRQSRLVRLVKASVSRLEETR
jgi:hypothetical protein